MEITISKFSKDSKIYIAGHRGLVGSAIVRRLQEAGYNNLITRTSSELDLRRQKETEDFFKKERPEYVFLAAAKVGGILANSKYCAEFIYDNIMISANIINSSYKIGVKKLLNLGSSCIYPRVCPQPMKEEYLLSGKLEPTNEPYAIAKISAIKLCRYYNKQYGMNFISVMPTNLYGPGDNFNLETAHVLPMLVRKFHLAKMLSKGNYTDISTDIKKYRLGSGRDEKINPEEKQPIDELLGEFGITKDYVKIWGTGKPYREFLYSDDLADACVFLMGKYDFKDIGEFVNIGCGEDRTILEYAELIKVTVGFKGAIRTDPSRPDGTPRKLLDLSRLTALGWKPHISMEDGLKQYYKYYTGN